MPRRPRSHLEDGIYYITARSTGGTSLFLADVDRTDFLRLFRSAVPRYSWLCHAYCLMGTHYHLVLEATRANLSLGMHWLNGTYAHHFNLRHHRRGHLFESRFSAWVVHDDQHLDATLRYVLENPVRAGLCDEPSSWPWAALPSPAPAPAPTPRGETSRPCAR